MVAPHLGVSLCIGESLELIQDVVINSSLQDTCAARHHVSCHLTPTYPLYQELPPAHVARGIILHPAAQGAEGLGTRLCKEVSKYCENQGEALRCHALLLHAQDRIQGAAPTEPSCQGLLGMSAQ